MQSGLQAAVRVVLGVASFSFSVLVSAMGLICGSSGGHLIACLPMSAAPNPAAAGATVTLDAKFAPSAQMSPSVQFYEGSTLLGAGPTDFSSRIAEFRATFNAGHHVLTAKAGTYHSPASPLAVFPNQGLYNANLGLFIVDYDASLIADAYVGFGGVPGDVALAGDVLGNGKDAFVIFRKGLWFVSSKWDGYADIVYAFGGKAGDIPLLADMDGDGKADLVIYRAGTWFVSTNRDGVANYHYYFGGVPGDIPMLADMDGDGNIDLVIYRSGMWFVSTNRDGVANQAFAFGGGGHDIPLASNWYVVDRIADPIIFRDGTWFVGTHATRDGTHGAMFSFGAPGDVPLLGTFR